MNCELGTSCKLAPAGVSNGIEKPEVLDKGTQIAITSEKPEVLDKGTQIAITSEKAAKLIKCID